MTKQDKTFWGVIGVLLVIFGILGTIAILSNREYSSWLLITGLSVVIGVVLVARVFSD